ncbi:hypothetical protein BKA14_007610 [Actinoplanes abujensis]|uniref:Uncharacterized protein n=1 Tax=Paractinoplanes abujensis TaxID=882441 RepID=A0A7W7G5Y5_9ACTN|nr:hypothetical protein [Actinoplanes abujensis]
MLRRLGRQRGNRAARAGTSCVRRLATTVGGQGARLWALRVDCGRARRRGGCGRADSGCTGHGGCEAGRLRRAGPGGPAVGAPVAGGATVGAAAARRAGYGARGVRQAGYGARGAAVAGWAGCERAGGGRGDGGRSGCAAGWLWGARGAEGWLWAREVRQAGCGRVGCGGCAVCRLWRRGSAAAVRWPGCGRAGRRLCGRFGGAGPGGDVKRGAPHRGRPFVKSCSGGWGLFSWS